MKPAPATSVRATSSLGGSAAAIAAASSRGGRRAAGTAARSAVRAQHLQGTRIGLAAVVSGKAGGKHRRVETGCERGSRSEKLINLAGGQSGNPLSPHYADLVERWRNFEHLTPAAPCRSPR